MLCCRKTGWRVFCKCVWEFLVFYKHTQGDNVALSVQEKQAIVKAHRQDEKDTGSCSVQIALLTANINKLQQHFANYKKDNHSRTGLIRMVNKRRKLLAYLKRTNFEVYSNLITTLKLRK